MPNKKASKDITISGLNFDDWLAKEDRVTDTMLVEETTLKYEQKIVAFLDLLGITNKITSAKDGEENEIIALMEKIRNLVFVEAQDYIDTNDLDVLYISDSFIFACSEKSLTQILDLLAIVQMRILIECKVMLRGAVEFGSAIVKDEGKQIIGPAYISAYLKQENDAIYPRIIISNSVRSLIDSKVPESAPQIMTFDRESALDYIKAYYIREGSRSIVASRLKREGVIDYLVESYKEFDKIDRPSIRRKYGWTINYFIESGVWPNEQKYNSWK